MSTCKSVFPTQDTASGDMNTQKIRVLVVDDEPPARRKLVRWLSEDDEVTVVAECANGFEAVDAITSSIVDVVFLDIQMPQMSGFEVIQQLPEASRPLVIFATAYDQYAIDAFRLHAIDYLLKPYDAVRFREALDHAKYQLQHQQANQLNQKLSALLTAMEQPDPFLSHFTVRHQDHVKLIKVEQVQWIAAEGNYVMLHLGNQIKHLIRESIGKLADRLDPRQFPRIHRSTIVNLDSVDGFYPASHGDYTITLKDGTQLFMSRSYKNKMRDLLQVGL